MSYKNIKKLSALLLCAVLMLIYSDIEINASNFTVEYRGFEVTMKQWDKEFQFVSGLPDELFEVNEDGTHTVLDITPKFDDYNFRDYTFDGWNLKEKGGVIDRSKVYRAGDVIKDITSDIQLIAVWKRKETDIVVYSIHAYLRGGGEYSNLIEGTAPEQKLLVPGDTITLIDCPYSYDGHKFVGWMDSKGHLYEPGATYTVETYNSVFTAEWVLDSTAVVKNTVTYSPGAEGVTGNPPNSFKLYKKNSFVLSENTYEYEDHKFIGWTDGQNIFQPGDIYIVPGEGDITLTAVWERLPGIYSINITAGDGGNVSPLGEMEIKQGESLEITATPDDGMVLKSVKVNGDDADCEDGKLIIDNVEEDLDILFEFAVKTHKITVNVDENGSIEPSGDIEVEEGKDITLTFIPDDGFEIDEVILDDELVETSDGKLTLKSVVSSHIVSVTFRELPVSQVSEAESVPAQENNKIGLIVALVVVILSLIALVILFFTRRSNKGF